MIWGCKSCTDSFDWGGYFWGSFIVWWCYIKTSHREDISIISYLSGYTSRTFYRRIPFSKSGYFSLVQYQQCLSFLTNFSPVSHFYTSWRRQKTFGFLMFSGGIEMWHWTKKFLIVVVCGESHQILDQYSKLLNFILIVSPKTQQKKLTNKNWLPS